MRSWLSLNLPVQRVHGVGIMSAVQTHLALIGGGGGGGVGVRIHVE